MHDRGDERDVEQRLAVQKRQVRRTTPDVRVPIGSDRHDDRRHEQEGRDQDIERGGDFELQGGAQVDRDRDTHPPDVHGAEQRLGSRNRRRGRTAAEPAHGRSFPLVPSRGRLPLGEP